MSHDLKLFQETVWDYYRSSARDLPWRHPEPDGSFDPYNIMVSEIMLQQTQVGRVIEKYQEFLDVFPDVSQLANATFAEVLTVWSGLGYNRRAKFLLLSAQAIISEHTGSFPVDTEALQKLPGIGKNTAAAIRVYAYNLPDVFIETNIRSVYIHSFFHGQESVDDKQLLPLIAETVDRENPREWYWALMDYGTFVKATYGNASRASKHYTKQSVFEGSRRQLRTRILKSLLDGPMTEEELAQLTPDKRLPGVLADLAREQLITESNKRFTLS